MGRVRDERRARRFDRYLFAAVGQLPLDRCRRSRSTGSRCSCARADRRCSSALPLLRDRRARPARIALKGCVSRTAIMSCCTASPSGCRHRSPERRCRRGLRPRANLDSQARMLPGELRQHRRERHLERNARRVDPQQPRHLARLGGQTFGRLADVVERRSGDREKPRTRLRSAKRCGWSAQTAARPAGPRRCARRGSPRTGSCPARPPQPRSRCCAQR